MWPKRLVRISEIFNRKKGKWTNRRAILCIKHRLDSPQLETPGGQVSVLHSVHTVDAAYGRAVSADADAPAASQSGPDTLPDSVSHRWEARRNTTRFTVSISGSQMH